MGLDRLKASLGKVANKVAERVADGIDTVGEMIDGDKPRNGKNMSNVIVVAEKGIVPTEDSNTIVVLEKGANIAIEATTKVVGFGLEWDEVKSGPSFDGDIAAVIVYGNKKNELVYFGMPKIDNKLLDTTESVFHTGDNLTGADDAVAGVAVNEDDETIFTDLSKLPADVEKVVFFVNIYNAETKGQNFGSTDAIGVRLYDAETGVVFMKADLMEDNATDISMIAGEFYRKDDAWKYKDIAAGGKLTMTEFANKYN